LEKVTQGKVETKLKELDELKTQISIEKNASEKSVLIAVYELEQTELQSRLQNLSGVGAQLGVAIAYLEGMRKV
jgi:hypothetical protein